MEKRRKKKVYKHLLIIRLLTSGIFLYYGITHFLFPEHFENILRYTIIPLVNFNLIFIPIAETTVGLLLLIGLYTRYIGLIGCVIMSLAITSTITLVHLQPSQFPGHIPSPYSMALITPIINFFLCLYVIIMGAGPYSIDNREKSSKPPTSLK